MIYHPFPQDSSILKSHLKDVKQPFKDWLQAQAHGKVSEVIKKDEIDRLLIGNIKELDELIQIIEERAKRYLFKWKEGNLYKNFRNRQWALKLLGHIDLNVCPYCNRQYTMTVQQQNKSVITPQFDHFYPKNQYPYLQVSLYNLIPCCGTCNQKKSTRELTRDIYPYEKSEARDQIVFELKQKDITVDQLYGMNQKGSPQIKVGMSGPSEAVVCLQDIFGIETIMNHHQRELRELLQRIVVYDSKWREDINKRWRCHLQESQHLTELEMKTILYGDIFNKESWSHTPLAKFRHDIYQLLVPSED